MSKITVLPHEKICPDGAVIEAEPGQSICRAMLGHGWTSFSEDHGLTA